MRYLVGAWTSLSSAGDAGFSQADDHDLEVAPEGLGSVARPIHAQRGGHPSSFIRRCWFPERKCDESSTCTDLRQLWEGVREDVKVLPPPEVCGRPQYIVTGASRSSRNGVIDANRLETLVFPGEKWHKCCVIVDPKNKKATPRFVCEHLKEVNRQKLMMEMKGWCGPHKCIGTRDRCLIVDEEKIDHHKPKYKNECPLACKTSCNQLKQKFECVYIGNEPPYGQEGQEAPLKPFGFGESEAYDVIGLQTADTSDKTFPELDPTKLAEKDPLKASTEEGCAPLEVAFFLPVPTAPEDSATRHQRWKRFLS